MGWFNARCVPVCGKPLNTICNFVLGADLKGDAIIMIGNVWLAFGLTTLAGLSTGIGSALAFFAKKSNKFLSVSLGFSAGVMIYVSIDRKSVV